MAIDALSTRNANTALGGSLSAAGTSLKAAKLVKAKALMGPALLLRG